MLICWCDTKDVAFSAAVPRTARLKTLTRGNCWFAPVKLTMPTLSNLMIYPASCYLISRL